MKKALVKAILRGVALLLAVALSVFVPADGFLLLVEAAQADVITGTSGDVTYTFNKTTGLLTFSGEGSTAVYATAADLSADTQWAEVRELVKEVVVEDGVTALGNRLFTSATQLTKVTLPASLETIATRCFTDCYALESVEFAEGSLALSKIDTVAFHACTSLETIDLSRTKLTELARKTFAACSSLTTVYIPGTVRSIVKDAFGDTNQNGTIVKTNNLTALYFGGTLAQWDNGSFVNASGNDNLTNGTCFVYCTDGLWAAGYPSDGGGLIYKLTNGTLTVYGSGPMADYAAGGAPWYANAASITSVVLQEGITSVGDNAFAGCTNLTTVEMGKSMEKIGISAFADCTKIANVNFHGTSAQWQSLKDAYGATNEPLFAATFNGAFSGACGDNVFWDFNAETKVLTISGEGPMWDWNLQSYQTVPWWSIKGEVEKLVFAEGVTATGRYAFCYMDELEEIQFASTVAVIGGYGFCWNEEIETLVLPEGVRFISGRAFSRVESVHTIYLPSTLEGVDMYAFMSNDDTVTISNVYYNGTKEDWNRVVVSTQGSNDKYLLPDADTTWHYLKDYTYYDDIPQNSTAWYKEAAYYLKDQFMVEGSGSFGVSEKADMNWVLNTLFVRAGASGAYTGGLEWAQVHGIVDDGVQGTDPLILNDLAEILYRTAKFNGHSVSLGTNTALAWCQTQGYIAAYQANVGSATDTSLTRSQAASVLAAYLQSTYGVAGRYTEMLTRFKTAYQAGGDGQMYILAVYHGGTGKVGDCTLILMPGGQLMLIDTFRADGWTNYLNKTLDFIGVTNLDYLVLSHGHGDHDANMSKLINKIYNAGYTIGNYWSAGQKVSNNERNAIALMESMGGITMEKKLRRGDRRIIGEGTDYEVVMDVVWPTNEKFDGDENNHSLSFILTYGESSYFTGGDLFMEGELAILDLYNGDFSELEVDVMKTNHHGSYSSNGMAWVNALNPKILVTHSDDIGDSAQCYTYSQQGRSCYSLGLDGGVLVVMDDQENISVTTGFDSGMRKNVVGCGILGHCFQSQMWHFDETGHWRQCERHWLCGVIETVQPHDGGVADSQGNAQCATCGATYQVQTATPGDFNGDGDVTNDDIIVLMWHCLFPEENPIDNFADFNGDGNITNDDIIILMWHCLFPEENPL